jgi:hypothetical protein
MPVRVQSLTLPLARTEGGREANRQLTLWAAQVTSVLNSLGANPGLQDSGNPGSAVTTVDFSGAGAAITISALMHFVRGGDSLATITPPRGFTGPFFLVARNSFALTSGGNLMLPAGSVALQADQVVAMVYDGANWYAAIQPSSNLLNVRIVTNDQSPYAVAPDDYVLLALAGTGSDTVIELPAASGSGRPLEVKKLDANPYNIALAPAAADTVDDAAGTFDILVRYASYTLVDYAPGKWAIL